MIKIAMTMENRPWFLYRVAKSIQEREGGDFRTILRNRYGIEITARQAELIIRFIKEGK